MDDVATFLVGLGVTLALSLAVVAYLNPHLRKVLTDLCGAEERAGFWAAFSNVSLVLLPLACAMFHRPGSGGAGVFFEVSDQLRLGLIGLIIAVVFLGLVIGLFIPRSLAAAR